MKREIKIVVKSDRTGTAGEVIQVWMQRRYPHQFVSDLLLSYWTVDGHACWWIKDDQRIQVVLNHLSLRSRHPLREQILAAALAEC